MNPTLEQFRRANRRRRIRLAFTIIVCAIALAAMTVGLVFLFQTAVLP